MNNYGFCIIIQWVLKYSFQKFNWFFDKVYYILVDILDLVMKKNENNVYWFTECS